MKLEAQSSCCYAGPHTDGKADCCCFYLTWIELSNHRSLPTLSPPPCMWDSGPLSEHYTLLLSLSRSLRLACSKPWPASLCCLIPGILLCRLSLHCVFRMISCSALIFFTTDPLCSRVLGRLVLGYVSASSEFDAPCSLLVAVIVLLWPSACVCACRVCLVWFIHEGQPFDGSSKSPASAHCK